MEARIIGCILSAFSIVAGLSHTAAARDYVTPNFTVRASSPQFAKRVGDLAEQFRRELAIHWLGRELPQWSGRCPITVRIEPHAGGETSFVFMPNRSGRSAPTQWQMKIYGSPERILDSVLPHEVTHTIFATHYGRPLPRWADEGACTTVEHDSEKNKNQRMLISFLKSKRGIPFNHMFAMKQYPSDILPLYAQGHSLVKFLVMLKGEKHFVNYIGSGMDVERPGRISTSWDHVTNKFYGYKNLSELQVDWLKWVSEGSKDINLTPPDSGVASTQIGANERRTDNDFPQRGSSLGSSNVRVIAPPPLPETLTTTQPVSHSNTTNDNWYLQQMRQDRSVAHSLQAPTKRFHERADAGTPGHQPGSTFGGMPPTNPGNSHINVPPTEPVVFDYTDSRRSPVDRRLDSKGSAGTGKASCCQAVYHAELRREKIWR